MDTPSQANKKRKKKPSAVSMKKLVAAEQKRRGYKICGAWKPSKGGVCCKRPMKGQKRCADDGGKSLKGRDSPSYTTGIHTNSLPTRSRAEYGEILDDPSLFNLDHETALLQLRMNQLLRGLDQDGHAKLRDQLKRATEKLRKATESSEYDSARKAISMVFELVDRGYDDRQKWEEVFELQDKKVKVLEANSRIKKHDKDTLSLQHYLIRMDQVAEIIREFVDDRDALRQIATALETTALFGSSGTPQA